MGFTCSTSGEFGSIPVIEQIVDDERLRDRSRGIEVGITFSLVQSPEVNSVYERLNSIIITF